MNFMSWCEAKNWFRHW